ncbi:myocyte-specific enhancer factor 2B-like [Brienomyrus brachyistius]|uniref:myocyte-specific enhancer factor 2B-like n=1 Tax=Brienomyrus brachyistius TaxID=42636 RepID=UPI0020B28D6A|nr:myocyte-specific enhancer factor 2B-like [Brienomyrus brachyistius]
MGRKKIQISRILDQRNRQVTFTKRKFGLMKKAYELSVLCDCEIALIIFNSTNRLFQYASTDMDKVLLKYTEYSEPHESRTNADILETLRRKGLGLEGVEVYSEEGVPVPAGKYQQLEESVDLSVARQRYYPPPAPPPEGPYLLSENGFSAGNGPGPAPHRSPAFKPGSFKPGTPSPTGSHAHSSLGPPHTGIGYSVFSHGGLGRTLDMKTSPPLNLGCDGRRIESHAGLPCSRANLNGGRVLYQGGHAGNHMIPMGKAEYPYGGFTHPASLHRYAMSHWQPSPPQDTAHGMPSGGCSLPVPSSAPPPHLRSSLNLSIKSERASPEHSGSPATPPLHRVEHQSPISNHEEAGHAHPEAYPIMEREDVPKGGYLCQHGSARPTAEDKGGMPIRQLEIVDGWQR